MSPYRKMRNWKLLPLYIVIVIAFVGLAWSFRQASHSGKQTRSALCQVLLYSRAASLEPQAGEPPRTDRQIDRINTFYMHVIELVKDCHIPTTGGTP